MTATKPKCIRRRCARPAEIREHCRSCYNLMLDYGQLASQLIDATQVRERIELHATRGRRPYTLAVEAGVEPATLYLLLDGTRRRVRHDIAGRILGVPLPPTTVGTLRRVQALARAGWGRDDVAEAIGMKPAAVRVAVLRQRFHPRMSLAIVDFYNRVRADQPGPSQVAAWMAASKDWAPIMAWEGVDIDDPEAMPRGLPSGPVPVSTTCGWCGQAFRPQKSTSRYCSTEHGDLAHSASKREQQATRRAAARQVAA